MNHLTINHQPSNPKPIKQRYRQDLDTGCHLAPSCLSCPFPRCAEEINPFQFARLFKSQQAHDLLTSGLSINDIAIKLAVSPRTIQRRLTII